MENQNKINQIDELTAGDIIAMGYEGIIELENQRIRNIQRGAR